MISRTKTLPVSRHTAEVDVTTPFSHLTKSSCNASSLYFSATARPVEASATFPFATHLQPHRALYLLLTVSSDVTKNFKALCVTSHTISLFWSPVPFMTWEINDIAHNPEDSYLLHIQI
jgi:hypothetical protein